MRVWGLGLGSTCFANKQTNRRTDEEWTTRCKRCAGQPETKLNFNSSFLFFYVSRKQICFVNFRFCFSQSSVRPSVHSSIVHPFVHPNACFNRNDRSVCVLVLASASSSSSVRSFLHPNGRRRDFAATNALGLRAGAPYFSERVDWGASCAGGP